MASGDIEMENLMGERQNLGDEPIYCAAYDDGEEVLYLGFDEALTQPERVAQRLRYEEHALRFLRGQRPRLISAALRGPFDQASGWRNPWLAARQASNRQGCAPNDSYKAHPAKVTSASAKAIIQTHQDDVEDLVNTAPALQDSMQCHLPSPQSNRELELADNTHFDSSSRSRIRDWAKNVHRDTLERDDFWAPDVGTDDASDGSSTTKRPAKQDWLKSKLNKRRRTENLSFASVSTPTPTPIVPGASALPAPSFTAPASQSLPHDRTNATKSFEQTTPSSIARQQSEESLREGASTTASHKSPAPITRPRKKVALKAHALRRSSRRQSKQPTKVLEDASDLSNCQSMDYRDASDMDNAAQPQETSRKHAKGGVVPEQDHLDGTASALEAIECAENSFESHRDDSFRYRAKSTKPAPIKIAPNNLVSQQSQITQTGTPDSDKPHEATLDEHAVAGHHDLDVVDYSMNEQGVTDMLVDITLQEDTLVAPKSIPTAVTESPTEHRPEPQRSEEELSEETATLSSLNSENGQEGLVQPQQATHGEQLSQTGPEQAMLFLGVENQPTPLHISIFRALEAGAALSTGAMEINTSRTSPIVDTPAQPEISEDSLPVEGVRESNIETPLAETGEVIVEVDQVKMSGPGGVKGGSSIESQTPDSCNQDGISNAHTEGNATGIYVPVEKVQEQSGDLEILIEASEDNDQEIMVPPSEEGVLGKGSVDEPSSHIQDPPPLVEITHDSADDNLTTTDNEEGGLQNNEVALQSPWASEGAQIKIEPVEEEAWVSSSRAVSIASSPMEVSPPLAIPLSQQQPWTSLENGSSYSAGLQASESLQHAVFRAPSGISGQSFPEKQSPWACSNSQPVYAARQAHLLGSQSLEDQSSPTQAPRFNSAPPTLMPTVSLLPQAKGIGYLAQPATPTTHLAQRQTTPEPILSIKSFATFNTPSPKYQRSSRHHRFSDGLPSTQYLADATNANPWTSSARSSLRSSVRTRSHLRVSFAPLPDEENNNIGDSVLDANVSKAASPPPQFSRAADEEDLGENFQKHFDAVSRRSSVETKILQPRATARLLPSESQQIQMSSGIGLMAQAFREADEGQDINSSPGPVIAVDESCQIPDAANSAEGQSPWRADTQSQGVDDVAAVLQNLDDFLNPRWDLETGVDKTRVADGEENFRSEPSPGFLGAVWDAF
ncbi:hypothetical protein E8E14_013470 [Neopestalotiopsis sp. 37M]|nr:hypothetical protein E8E14_013470 [Neopestalotiopsis sp. 37M]